MSDDEPLLQHYFIYYRIRDDIDVDDAHASVRSMQIDLQKKSGVAGRLFIRSHEDATWMEVYEGVSAPQAFEQTLSELIRIHGLEDLVQQGSARHMERFTECV